MPPRSRRAPLAVLLVLVVSSASVRPTEASNLLDLPANDGRDPKITGVWFFNYVHEDVYSEPNDPDRSPDFTRFEIQRGYLTYSVRITDRLDVRVTSDISVDQEGDGAGDIELRLKYGYIEFDTGDLGPLRATNVRAGVLQTPWISFEQTINDFRLQGPMFLNRERIYVSADYGVGFFANLGEPIAEGHRRDVNRRNAGRWGSLAVGIYNGGGYNEIEQNESFVSQARLTLRPLPDAAPGLQVSGGFAIGRGNTTEAPEYRSTVVMLSHESRRGAFTLTGYDGYGDLRGREVDDDGESLHQKGASAFGELRFLRHFSTIARYDFLRREAEPGDLDTERWLTGVTWRCIPGGQLLLDYENQKLLGGPIVRRNEKVELGLEVRF